MDVKNRYRFDGFEQIPLRISVKVGAATRTLAQLDALAPGDFVELDRRIGEAFELLGHGYLLAHVEPVANGDRVAVKLVEVAEDDDAPDC